MSSYSTHLKSAVGHVSVDFHRFVRVGHILNGIVEIQFPFVLLDRSFHGAVRVVRFVGIVSVVVVASAAQRVAHRLDVLAAAVRHSAPVVVTVVIHTLAHHSAIRHHHGQHANGQLQNKF